MEILYDILQFLGTTAGVTVIVIGLTRLLPNTTTYLWGKRCGTWLSALGNVRWGLKYELMEDFAEQSFGQLLKGFKDGLDSDDE